MTLIQSIRSCLANSCLPCFLPSKDKQKSTSFMPSFPETPAANSLSKSTSLHPKGETVNKTSLLSACVLISGAILSSFHLCARESRLSPSSVNMVLFSPVEGRAWVEKCIKKHPEILLLADAHVRKTEEGQATLEGSYSEQLFGLKYIEFDRTIMTLHCLRLLLDENVKQAYETFTKAQPADKKLSFDSFKTLHDQGQKILHSRWGGLSKFELAEAMEAALVLGDIGKSVKARQLFEPYHIGAPDHDDFHGEAMAVLEKKPQLCPSFARLSPQAKALLVKVANLAHYGHITHLEGSPGMFTKLRESGVPVQDPEAIDFDLFVHTCDVAGALGHVNNESSIVYTEQAHQAMQAMGQSVRVLSDADKTEWEAYDAYLEKRAAWLGLDAHDSGDRVLARIGAMLRLFTKEEGDVLRKAMSQIDEQTRQRISAQLDVHQQDLTMRTPTYMPAMLVNLLNNRTLGASVEERLQNTIMIGLPLIARVLEEYKTMLVEQRIDADVPLNFNAMAGVAKSAPERLYEKFTIDREGMIHLLAK